MARGLEQRVGPPTLLMYDTGKVTVDVVPWRAWSSRESLNTSKCRVLEVVNYKVQASRIGYGLPGSQLGAVTGHEN